MKKLVIRFLEKGLLTCALTASSFAGTTSVVFDSNLASSGKPTPLFAAQSSDQGQSLICISATNKGGGLMSPQKIYLINHEDPEGCLELTFGKTGNLISIASAGGHKITITVKNGKGGLVTTTFTFAKNGKKFARVVETDGPRGVMQREAGTKLFSSPFRIGWGHLGLSKEEARNGFPEFDIGQSLVSIVDTSLDGVTKIIEDSFMIASRGGSTVSQITGILESWVDDELDILADESESKSLNFLKDAYNLSEIGGDLGSFYKKPSLLNLPRALDGLSKLEELLATGDSTAIEVDPEVVLGSFTVEAVRNERSYYLGVENAAGNSVTITRDGSDRYSEVYQGEARFVTPVIPGRLPGTKDSFRIEDDFSGEVEEFDHVTPQPPNGALVAHDSILTAIINSNVSSELGHSGASGFTVISGPFNGKITSFNPQTGEFTYSPDTGFMGSDKFDFVVSRDAEMSEAGTVTIVVKSGGDVWRERLTGGVWASDYFVDLARKNYRFRFFDPALSGFSWFSYEKWYFADVSDDSDGWTEYTSSFNLTDFTYATRGDLPPMYWLGPAWSRSYGFREGPEGTVLMVEWHPGLGDVDREHILTRE